MGQKQVIMLKWVVMAYKPSFKNTSYQGNVRTLIYEEGGVWYGVALEFNIVESGDSPQEVMVLLAEAINGYVEATNIAKSSISVLNQEVDPLFEKLWDYDHKGKSKFRQKVYSAGRQPIAVSA